MTSMRRPWVVFLILAGWVALTCATVAPLLGVVLSLFDPRRISTEVVQVPHAGRLLLYSMTVCGIATALSVFLGIGPAALLGGITRSRLKRVLLTGLCIAPLLIPPQVYAYAWSLATAPNRL